MSKLKWLWYDKETTLDDVKKCVGPGWGDLIERLVNDLFALGWDGGIYQVKEKFAGLRFYTDDTPEAIGKRIAEAESESYKICEICGKPGSVRTNRSWIVTLCDEHDKLPVLTPKV